MGARIDNTTTATQKGTPFPASRDKIRHSQSLTLTTLGDGHAVPSIFVATPAASTKVEKLMDTLSDPSSLPAGEAGIGILSVATRAKDLSALCLGNIHASLNHESRFTNYLDTPVEIEKGFSHAESTTSQNPFRYTFDMSEKGDFRT